MPVFFSHTTIRRETSTLVTGRQGQSSAAIIIFASALTWVSIGSSWVQMALRFWGSDSPVRGALSTTMLSEQSMMRTSAGI